MFAFCMFVDAMTTLAGYNAFLSVAVRPYYLVALMKKNKGGINNHAVQCYMQNCDLDVHFHGGGGYPLTHRYITWLFLCVHLKQLVAAII